jgi:colanic acid/amylovoran biosynthesis glycosyltransferase
MHIGYVVKRYPRFSETFVVNEILAHERAGVPVEIFAVRRVNESCFQSILGEVRSPVTYIADSTPKADGLWQALRAGATRLPGFWSHFESCQSEDMGDVLQGIALALHVREKGITHLHAHFATIATTVARLAARFAGIGYSFTAHAKDIFHEDVDQVALADKLADAKAVVTVSDFNVDFLLANFPAVGERLSRIYNGLSLDDFAYRTPATRPKRIVAVGRLVEKKGFATLIEACAELANRGAAFSCEIIGEGPQRPALEALIAHHGLESRVKLRGALPITEVARALAGAAVHALPCIVADDGDRDGLPTVLIEAMALGTPCVSTDVTGIPELIRDGETGFCVPQRDYVALAAAMETLLRQPALRVRIAEAARALIETHFDADRNAAMLRSLFQQSVDAAPMLRAAG